MYNLYCYNIKNYGAKLYNQNKAINIFTIKIADMIYNNLKSFFNF